MKKARLLDPHCEAILQEYQDNLPRFREVEQEVKDKLRHTLADAGLLVAAIESRVKGYDSLAGKLELKGHKYKSLADLTDILGLRVITFYIDDVDKVASAVERICHCITSVRFRVSRTALRYRCAPFCSTHGPTWIMIPATNRVWRYPNAICVT